MQQEEEAEAPARPPRPEPAAAGPVQAGRPYRDFVEGESERFRRELENDLSLDAPGRQETGAAALPEPSRAARSTPGPGRGLAREHLAVIAMQTHLIETGSITPPYSRLEAEPDFVEALIQLADDAGWLVREAPAPRAPSRPRGHMGRTEAAVERILYVLQASFSAFMPGSARGFDRR